MSNEKQEKPSKPVNPYKPNDDGIRVSQKSKDKNKKE